MPSINVNPTDIPTPDDLQYWAEEAAAYKYQAPNPHAPKDSPEYRGWGIPESRLAPPDAVEWVICKYREEKLDLHCHDPREEYRYSAVHPKFKWALIEAVFAHFLWFREMEGGQWINNFFGIQEVKPFYKGYRYKWINPKTKKISDLLPPEYDRDRKLLPDSVELRIFRQWERSNLPPFQFIDSDKDVFRQMTKLMQVRTPEQGWSNRNPRARAAGEQLPGVYKFVSKMLQEWFALAAPKERWPIYKNGRITGAQWVRSLEVAPRVPVFGGLAKIAHYHNASYRERTAGPVRAYRIQQGGNVHWCAGNEMRIMPKTDALRMANQPGLEEALKEFHCSGCRRTKTCVPHNSREKLCCNCYSTQLEQGTNRPTLDLCTMLPECKRCPDNIESNSRLTTLKQRWGGTNRTGTSY
jgi:hypothetical protein